MTDKLPIVVLISGRGSNLQAIVQADDPLVEIRAVISNRPQAAGLSYAQTQGIVTEVVDHKDYSNRGEFDCVLQQTIDRYAPKLVVLAGFMRILTAEFVRAYHGRLLNIHPSLLPEFKGLHTHERALAAKAKTHGATVHFVTEMLDDGPIILQARVPVLPDDDVDSLAARVLAEEHKIYPQVIHWFAEGRLNLVNNRALLDGQPRTETHKTCLSA